MVVSNSFLSPLETKESVEPMDAPRRHAIMECVAWWRRIFYENLMQLQEIPQKTMPHLRLHHFTMGSVTAVPYTDVTRWRNCSKM